jgi:hypothetical protein
MPPKTIRMNKAMTARDATIAPIIFSILRLVPLRLKAADYQTKHLLLHDNVKLSYFSSRLFRGSIVNACQGRALIPHCRQDSRAGLVIEAPRGAVTSPFVV